MHPEKQVALEDIANPCLHVDVQVTDTVYDGVEAIRDYDGVSGGGLNFYVHGAGVDEMVATYDNGARGGVVGWYLVVADYAGSTIAIQKHGATTAPDPEDIYTYSSYGEVNNTSGFPFRYTGRRLDAETGLYYYRARYYSPVLGRFLQTDPIGYGDNMNMYAYVANDPVNAIDPSGENSSRHHESSQPKINPATAQAQAQANLSQGQSSGNLSGVQKFAGAMSSVLDFEAAKMEAVASTGPQSSKLTTLVKTVGKIAVAGQITSSVLNVAADVQNGTPLDEAVVGEIAAVGSTVLVGLTAAGLTASTGVGAPVAPVIGVGTAIAFDLAGGDDIVKEEAKAAYRDFKENE